MICLVGRFVTLFTDFSHKIRAMENKQPNKCALWIFLGMTEEQLAQNLFKNFFSGRQFGAKSITSRKIDPNFFPFFEKIGVIASWFHTRYLNMNCL